MKILKIKLNKTAEHDVFSQFNMEKYEAVGFS